MKRYVTIEFDIVEFVNFYQFDGMIVQDFSVITNY